MKRRPVKERKEGDPPLQSEVDYFSNYDPKFSHWRYMGMIVAKEFKVRPNVVYSEWESLEVLITFGVLMNDISKESWQAQQARKDNYKPPIIESEYAVTFKTMEMLEHDAKHNKGE